MHSMNNQEVVANIGNAKMPRNVEDAKCKSPAKVHRIVRSSEWMPGAAVIFAKDVFVLLFSKSM